MSETTVLARSPLGAHWIDRTSHGQTANERFVFFQDPQGRIKYSSGGGSGVSSTVLEASEAPFNNQFAILGWGSHSANRRFYYITKTGDLLERTTRPPPGPPDGVTWRPGNLRGFKTAPYSNLGAIRNGDAQFHVFYQDSATDEIREVFTNDENTWQSGSSNLPIAIKGTSIAVTQVEGGVKIYFQQPDLSIVAYEGRVGAGGIEGWTKVNFESHWSFNPGAAISAARDKVFTVSADNKLNVHGPNGLQIQLGSVVPLASVAAISYPQTSSQNEVLSAYTQTSAYKITEFLFKADGTWTQREPVTPQ